MQLSGASERAHLRRGRGGCPTHGGASERRLRGRLGNNGFGQCNVPALPAGLTYVLIAAGGTHTVARRSDGSVVCWGSNVDLACNVPTPPAGVTYVDVAVGGVHTVARRSDGSVVVFGLIWAVPALPAGLTYVEVAAGDSHAVARRSDGSVVAWGRTSKVQCNVLPLPTGLTYVEVAAGGNYSLARRSDGSVVAWGQNNAGQCNVPPPPPGRTYVGIAAGWQTHDRAAERRLPRGLGMEPLGQCNVPALPAGLTYVEVAAGRYHSVALRSTDRSSAGETTVGARRTCPEPPAGPHLRRGCGRQGSHRRRGGAMALPSRGATTSSARRTSPAALGPHLHPGCGDQWVGQSHRGSLRRRRPGQPGRRRLRRSWHPGAACTAPQIGQNVFLMLTSGTPNAAGFCSPAESRRCPIHLAEDARCRSISRPRCRSPRLRRTARALGDSPSSCCFSEPVLVGNQFALQSALFPTSGPLGST